MVNCGPVLFVGTFLAAIAEWWAVWRNSKRLEYFAKPVTMFLLFAWLVKTGGLDGALLWFGVGVLFSLAGDIFLMFSDRYFLYGLVAFLLAHVAYLIGFNTPFPQAAATWGIGIAIVLGLTALRVTRRITAAIRSKGQNRLVAPVALYSTVITLMLLSALLTLFRPDWASTPALLVSLGAFLFYLSDLILAWNKFVTPIKNGRLVNIAIYHLGQIALVAGVVMQFSN